MRRLTGLIDSIEYVITEHDRGQVEVPSILRPQFLDHQGNLVTGHALESRARELFGATITIQDYAAGETPPDVTPEEDA